MITVEVVGTGWKLTYKVVGPDAPGSIVSTVLTPLDGKPSGQTMGIKRIDSRDTFTVLKFQGKETGISKAAISPDGKLLTVENLLRDLKPQRAGRQADPVLGQAVMRISSRCRMSNASKCLKPWSGGRGDKSLPWRIL